MSAFDRIEVDKLSLLYEGDKVRDASSRIRGFLFQDYVTIKCLLQTDVKYVCSEYLEDVDVFYEDGRFEFIQVKYYPKSSPDMEEISTDLYYQYLRLQMLQSELTAIPKLYIHREPRVKKLTLEDMKGYVDLKKVYPNTGIDLKTATLQEWKQWFSKNVYSTKKKEEQKKKLFEKMASETSLKEFVDKFTISHQLNITQYKQELMEELSKVYPNPDETGDRERWQIILLGLATSRIQQRYSLDNPDFEKLRVDKKEFDRYMKESIQTKTEQTIASYLVGKVSQRYGDIIKNNDLSDLQINMLNRIYQKTIQWVGEIGATINGQYQLLNTISTDERSQIDGYKCATIDKRLGYIAECKDGFAVFLGYLWKIMLNICQDNVTDLEEADDYSELFDPKHYIVLTVTDYVCFKFPEDKYIHHSVILPRAGSEFKGLKRKIVGRMISISPRPEKWFFENNKITSGKNYYDYNTANVNENPTVADLGEDAFYVECMDCIGIDEDEWSIWESCDDCIFSMECKKEGTLL